MTQATLLTGLLIFGARICDVSVGTLRTLMVVNGRRGWAWLLGFFEVLIWVIAASFVLQNVTRVPFYAVMFALGAATGSYVGLTVERRVAFGHQIVRVFTRRGRAVAERLRDEGFPVTEIDGRGRSGPVELLFVEVMRRNAMRVIRLARELDPECHYILDDVRLTSATRLRLHEPSGWRAVFKRK
jgi:uncharacterized protein YebE (UPF0316 family)